MNHSLNYYQPFHRIIGILVLFFSGLQVSAQTYFLNGDAVSLGNDCYRLTGEFNTQNGTVWYADQLDLNEPFDIQFQMNLGDLDANGADGICFVLQTVGTAAIGESGGGMGYLNFGTSLGIEFDTWQNGEYGDPIYDHIAIEQDGDINHLGAGNIAGPVQMSALSANTEDGQDHVVEITWDPDSQVVSVYFDCTFRLSGTVDLINDVFNGQSTVYWGFTAATGGSYNNQVVCLQENILAVGGNVTICTGSSALLSVAGNTQGTYQWSPPDYLDDPTSPTPVASPPVTTTYSVTFSDLCGNTLTDEIVVAVEDLEVSLPTDLQLSCSNPTLILSSSSNFNNNLDYSWTTSDGNIVTGNGTNQIVLDAPGTYSVEASYQEACIASAATVVTSDYSDFDGFAFADGEVTCADPSVLLLASSSFANADYLWTTTDGTLSGNPNNAQVGATEGGTYTALIYLNEFCQQSVDVEVVANLEVVPPNAGTDQFITCVQSTADLDGSVAATGYTILWMTTGGSIDSDPNELSIVAGEAGSYTLSVTNPDNGCISTDVVTVVADLGAPQVNIPVPDSLTCIHPEVTLIADASPSEVNYNWTTSNGVITGSATQPAAVASSDGQYLVTVTDPDNGCTSSASVNVFSSEVFQFDLSSLTFPNIVTRNLDSRNEEWRPYLADDPDQDIEVIFLQYELKIYDRWGHLVHDSDGDGRTWKPKETERDGTYFFLLRFETLCGSGASGTREGYIELITQ